VLYSFLIHLVVVFIMHERLTNRLRKPLLSARKESRKKERIGTMIQKMEQILKVFYCRKIRGGGASKAVFALPRNFALADDSRLKVFF